MSKRKVLRWVLNSDTVEIYIADRQAANCRQMERLNYCPSASVQIVASLLKIGQSVSWVQIAVSLLEIGQSVNWVQIAASQLEIGQSVNSVQNAASLLEIGQSVNCF